MMTTCTPIKKIRVYWITGMLAWMSLPSAGQMSHQVEVTSNLFTPAELTIAAGDTVIWTNSQGTHNVNGTQATFASNPESFGNEVGSGWTFSHVFTIPGTYDYRCDPHVAFGMVGKVTVEEAASDSLTINFSGMTPHVGQVGWILVTDDDTGEELERSSGIIEESFTVKVGGIVAGNDYTVEIFADHNGNGYYDAPPTDHAWRYELVNVTENEILEVIHNTNFTDIEWDHRVFVNLSGMTPHLGQEIYFALIDQETGKVIDRESEIVDESFTVELSEIRPGKSYRVDFFSDHNGNGYYDAPPTDHAWRLEIAGATGDEILDFVHNTSFTDILWKHRLRVRFSGMTPHLGQKLTLFVRELNAGTYLDTLVVDAIEEAEFDLKSYTLEPLGSYQVDFYADHNGNGFYDAPPADHAWRIEAGVAMGDLDIDFAHNTDFTDIFAVTGVPAAPGVTEVLLFPNPAEEFLHISSGSAIESVILFNSIGSEIRTWTHRGSTHVALSLEGIRSGIYFVEVITADRLRSVNRLVKQ